MICRGTTTASVFFSLMQWGGVCILADTDKSKSDQTEEKDQCRVSFLCALSFWWPKCHSGFSLMLVDRQIFCWMLADISLWAKQLVGFQCQTASFQRCLLTSTQKILHTSFKLLGYHHIAICIYCVQCWIFGKFGNPLAPNFVFKNFHPWLCGKISRTWVLQVEHI